MDVEADIDIKFLTEAIKHAVPSLQEVRVFGSYNNGNWKREKSDIDIFVLIADEYFSSYRDREAFGYYQIIESKQRREIRKNIKNSYRGNHFDMFQIFLCTPKDLEYLKKRDEGKGFIGINMMNGRLLYP